MSQNEDDEMLSVEEILRANYYGYLGIFSFSPMPGVPLISFFCTVPFDNMYFQEIDGLYTPIVRTTCITGVDVNDFILQIEDSKPFFIPIIDLLKLNELPDNYVNTLDTEEALLSFKGQLSLLNSYYNFLQPIDKETLLTSFPKMLDNSTLH